MWKSYIKVYKYLKTVAAYLDDVFVFDIYPDLASPVDTTRGFFENLRRHNLKRPPANKAKRGATEVDFLGYTISSSGASPNAFKATPPHKTYMHIYAHYNHN